MEKQFLYLLNDARLHRKSEYRVLNYQKLFYISMYHSVLSLIYSQIYHFQDFPEELNKTWKKEVLRSSAIQTIKTDRFLYLYKRLNEENLVVLLVKGLIIRSLYPFPDYRPSGDEDLYVSNMDCHKTKEILLNEGLDIVSESDDVTTFFDSKTGLSLELHVFLFPKNNDVYGKFQKAFDHAFDSPVVHTISGVNIYSLNYDLHILFLFLHFIKHFLHSGVGIRQLLDIVVYIESYGNRIDWGKFFGILDDYDLLTFTYTVLALAIDYFTLDISKIMLPSSFNKADYNYQDLLSDIIDAGVYGNSSRERIHSSTMTLNAAKSGRVSVLKSVFPSRKELKHKYTYLNKCPFLLPLAWIDRIYHYLMNKSEGEASKTISIGNKRIDLLKKYKIIK